MYGGANVSRSNTVFIGRKPVLNYVLACMTLFKSGQEEVMVKARGRAISRAVDVVEVIRNRFMPDVKVGDINIGTEELMTEERNAPMNVSTIEIKLHR
ncbi:MAG: DNA-binding protein Alba [Candidatus Bathyarchaeia archaeon]